MIKVNVTLASGNTTETWTAWVLKNGTVAAVWASISGMGEMNFTGPTANEYAELAFIGFSAEIEFNQNVANFTTSSQFNSLGTSSVTIGGIPMTVTTYVSNTLGKPVSFCGGSSTYTTFQLSVGTPPGTNNPIVTSLDYAGTTTINGSSSSISMTLKVTSFTAA